MHNLAVYVKEGLSFPQNVSLENSADSYISIDFTSFSVLTHFPLFITLFIFMHVFNWILSNIDEGFSINLSANVFVVGDFNVHNKD